MRRAYVYLLLLWIPLGDLIGAWAYGGGAFAEVGWLRLARDATVIAVAALALLTNRMRRLVLLPLLAYLALAAVYLPASLALGAPFGLALASLGTLLIAPLFFLVGHHCLRRPDELASAVVLVTGIALTSALFGFWEIDHTSFWRDTVHFPEYYAKVKGVEIGANPANGLPWNFFVNEDQARRAAGLLAAPLAQGPFLVVAGLCGFALLGRQRPWLGAAFLAVIAAGVAWSGTRGAMLAGFLALAGFVATESALLRHRGGRMGLLAVLVMAGAVSSILVVETSIEEREGSTLGHWQALQRNIADIDQAWLTGCGLGCQGPMAAQIQGTSLGGGEGAFFSIAFQIGLPGGLLFLAFLGALLVALWRAWRAGGGPLPLALLWLGMGLATTLVSSDLMLSVSGLAAFWLLCGGALRTCRPVPVVAGA